MSAPTCVGAAKSMRMRDNMLWMVGGNMVYMACQWAVLIAAVKLGNPVMVGRFSFSFAVCAPVFLLAQLRLRAASATDAKLDFAPSDYITLRLFGTTAALAAVGAICGIGNYSSETREALLIVALAKAIESGSDVLYGISQHAERMHSIAISMCLRGLLSLGGFVLLLRTTHRLLPALVGFTIGWGIVFVGYDLPQALTCMQRIGMPKLWSSVRWNKLKLLCQVTIPLGCAAMLMSLAMNMPRYFVEHFLGPGELGIFSALSYITLTGTVMVNSIVEAAAPRFSQYLASSRYEDARRLSLRLLSITGCFSALGIFCAALFSHPILTIVYKTEYANSTLLMTTLMLGAGVSNLASVCNYLLVAGRHVMTHLVALAALAIMMLLGCLFAVPRWGVIGAADASFVAFGVQLCWSLWSVRRLLKPCNLLDESNSGISFDPIEILLASKKIVSLSYPENGDA